MTDPSQQIADLIAAGQKIEAIKLLREQTGLGLAEAKAAVERLEQGVPPPAASAPDAVPPPLSDDVRRLVDQGKLIEAIRLLRERTGMGLKDAKDHIDRCTGRVHKVGCGGALLLLAALLVGLVCC